MLCDLLLQLPAASEVCLQTASCLLPDVPFQQQGLAPMPLKGELWIQTSAQHIVFLLYGQELYQPDSSSRRISAKSINTGLMKESVMKAELAYILL